MRTIATCRFFVNKYENMGGEWEAVAANQPEGPYKIVNYFKEIAHGHALIHGRSDVTEADLEIAAHRRLCGVSHPTARRYLEELSLLGIMTLEKGLPETNTPYTVRLAADFAWLYPLKRCFLDDVDCAL